MPDYDGGHFEGANLKTAAKLQVLEKYLVPYTNIMDQNWKYDDVWYVDTHAGSGKTVTNNGVELDGGALRAIRNHSDSFDAFFLYEVDPSHFELLCRTIEEEFGFDMNIGVPDTPDQDFRMAKHDPYDGPKIVAFEMDSNRGVSRLAEREDENNHWFVFADPAGLTVHRSTIDSIISRSNVDVLINYQTEGVLRNSGAEHGQGAVRRQHGDDSWRDAETPQEYVDSYCEALEEHPDLQTESKDMTPPPLFDDQYRFDMVFAAENDTARKIIADIWNNDNLWEDANAELGDPGLGQWT